MNKVGGGGGGGSEDVQQTLINVINPLKRIGSVYFKTIKGLCSVPLNWAHC